MSQIIAANAFKVVEGRPVTSSRIVAEYFGKQHHHVVRDIRTLISQKPDLERNANFGECSETINLANGATRQVPFFSFGAMNMDLWTLVAIFGVIGAAFALYLLRGLPPKHRH